MQIAIHSAEGITLDVQVLAVFVLLVVLILRAGSSFGDPPAAEFTPSMELRITAADWTRELRIAIWAPLAPVLRTLTRRGDSRPLFILDI